MPIFEQHGTADTALVYTGTSITQCIANAKVRLGRIENGVHMWQGFSSVLAWDFLKDFFLP